MTLFHHVRPPEGTLSKHVPFCSLVCVFLLQEEENKEKTNSNIQIIRLHVPGIGLKHRTVAISQKYHPNKREIVAYNNALYPDSYFTEVSKQVQWCTARAHPLKRHARLWGIQLSHERFCSDFYIGNKAASL